MDGKPELTSLGPRVADENVSAREQEIWERGDHGFHGKGGRLTCGRWPKKLLTCEEIGGPFLAGSGSFRKPVVAMGLEERNWGLMSRLREDRENTRDWGDTLTR